jgi:hypothetical protein
MDLLDWTFSPPFMPLVHRWDRLLVLHLHLAVKKELSGGMKPEERRQKLKALKALMSFLKPLLTPSVSALTETRHTASISRAHRGSLLWSTSWIIVGLTVLQAPQRHYLPLGRWRACTCHALVLP